MNDGEVYRHTDELGQTIQTGMEELFVKQGISGVVARQGSAFCWYFMDHCPVDWHDLAEHHDFAADAAFRSHLVERGIYAFPLPPKQCSISAAHTAEDIDHTLAQMEDALTQVLENTTAASAGKQR
jgi:glutamate-1-semialdehyde 2,1-aminomutase